MPTPASSYIEARVLAALNSTAMATAAGLTLANWTTPPHVFHGAKLGLIGGRNRGRMPFMTYNCDIPGFRQDTVEGGTMQAQVQLECIVGGADHDTAHTLSQVMMATAFALIRSESTDNFLALGNDAMESLEIMAWGHRLTGTMDVELTFDRSTYQVG